MAKRKTAAQDSDALQNEHRAIVSLANEFSNEISGQLSRILSSEGIDLGFPIQRRVKSWESISDKLTRMPSLKLETIRNLQDLIGLRIVLLFRRDVERVSDLIRKSLTVTREYDTQERLKQDQFGYSSRHFIVNLPDSWLAVPTLQSFRDLKAEVQVRTLAQHTWAEASHALHYKQEAGVPPSVLRSIYRVSALLETIDLELERVLVDRDAYRESMNKSRSDDRLNVDLLESVLDRLLPAANKGDDEDYAEMVSELMYSEIQTVAELEELIDAYLPEALKRERRHLRLDRMEAEKNNWDNVESPERLARGVYFTHEGLVRMMLAAAKKASPAVR